MNAIREINARLLKLKRPNWCECADDSSKFWRDVVKARWKYFSSDIDEDDDVVLFIKRKYRELDGRGKKFFLCWFLIFVLTCFVYVIFRSRFLW